MIAATIWLAASVAAAASVAFDLVRRGGQKMWIIDIVWPVTALWAGPIGAWAYWRFGRIGNQRIGKPPEQPFPVIAAKATSHCGAGCTLADLLAAGLAVFVGFATSYPINVMLLHRGLKERM